MRFLPTVPPNHQCVFVFVLAMSQGLWNLSPLIKDLTCSSKYWTTTELPNPWGLYSKRDLLLWMLAVISKDVRTPREPVR